MADNRGEIAYAGVTLYLPTYVREGLMQAREHYQQSISKLVLHAILTTYPQIKQLEKTTPTRLVRF